MEEQNVIDVVENAQARKREAGNRETLRNDLAEAAREYRHRQNSRLLWRLLGCTVFGSLCVLQVLYPDLAKGLSFAGLLGACCMAAVLVDRHVGRSR